MNLITTRKPFTTKSPDELSQYLKMGLGGIAGSGKTHFAGTVGKGNKVLFLDMEGGAETFSSKSFRDDPNATERDNIEVVSFEEYNVGGSKSIMDFTRAVEEIFKYLVSSTASTITPEYTVVVLDSLTELQEKFLALHTAKDPRQAYGDFRRFSYSITTMARAINSHVLFNSRIRLVEDEVNGIDVVRFSVSPSSWEVISGLLTSVGYLTLKQQGNNARRIADFNFGTRYRGKDRLNLGEVQNPSLVEIIRLAGEHRNAA